MIFRVFKVNKTIPVIRPAAAVLGVGDVCLQGTRSVSDRIEGISDVDRVAEVVSEGERVHLKCFFTVTQ